MNYLTSSLIKSILLDLLLPTCLLSTLKIHYIHIRKPFIRYISVSYNIYLTLLSNIHPYIPLNLLIFIYLIHLLLCFAFKYSILFNFPIWWNFSTTFYISYRPTYYTLQ